MNRYGDMMEALRTTSKSKTSEKEERRRDYP